VHPYHLYFLELHRERIARFDRDMARHYEETASPTAAPVSRARAGLLRRRPAQLMARDAC
jgi:hypothetical protein